MDFGVTVLPDPPFSRWLELIQLAERHGFGYAWTYDSHVLWQESIPMLAIAARETSTIKLGHFVTNPATRDPTVLASSYATLHDLSNGRMAMGVGRGDSAVRFIGRQPMKVAEFEQALGMIHDFMNGREVHWNDKDLQLKWVRPELPPIPVWVAGYGPKALRAAGRVADGVISLAQMTGAAIIPISYRPTWKISLNSWDGFMIPLPFGRVRLHIGAPLVVPRDADEQQREDKRLELENVLKSLSEL